MESERGSDKFDLLYRSAYSAIVRSVYLIVLGWWSCLGNYA